MHPSLTIYDDSVKDFINTDFKLETLASDCLFTEGPVWNAEGFYLFSDITSNTVYKLVPGKSKEVYISKSGTAKEGDEELKPDQVGSNALAYDNDGTLLVCRHGSHEIAKWNGSQLESFLSSYNGRPFNSPNDIVVAKDGSIFFSDPPYGLKEGKLNPQKFQPLAASYCYRQGELKIFSEKYQYPNGVCLSPEESEVFLCSNKPFEKFVSVHDAKTLAFKRIFTEENSDGIKCDPHGNVYLCNKDGIIVYNKAGERLALLKFSTIPANCCWGGKDGKDLFVCARENVFLVKNFLG